MWFLSCPVIREGKGLLCFICLSLQLKTFIHISYFFLDLGYCIVLYKSCGHFVQIN